MSFVKLCRHLKTINHHKRLVMHYCFKVGLYRQGLMHDLSKYSITELRTGAKYYQGDRSPNNAEREATGVSLAWLHHKGRNKHHLEYWIDYAADQSGFTGMKMPVKYVVEMFCDRISASRTYLGDKYRDDSPLRYFEKSEDKYGSLFNEKSRELLRFMLTMLARDGEEKTLRYIKDEILTGKSPAVRDY